MEKNIRIAVLFGGDGYIGRNLLRRLLLNEVFERYYVFDINRTEVLLDVYALSNVTFINGDVRESIPSFIKEPPHKESWIFNFAAIHREPGHEFAEYFDTNIPGAENVCEFAVNSKISNIFFTSSIAPYGKSLDQRTEESNLYPETAYGISKALAEKIHESWLLNGDDRKLIIVRPSVIFGPHDPGNVYRMIKSLKRGTFVLPNGGKVIKGYGYIYGLIDSILFTINQNKRKIVYNYAENPLVPLQEMVKITKEELDYRKPTFNVPVNILAMIARIVQIFFKLIGKRSDIHPVRVKKAGFPTNIKPEYLIENNFDFKYSYDKALKHWRQEAPEDFT